jgi:cysteine desulfurase
LAFDFQSVNLEAPQNYRISIMSEPVYLDYNATTPMDPRVLEAMIPWFLTPSNAGSRTHVYGKRAKDAVENARKQIADLLGAKPEEIFFTSGATESNNIAILGLRAHAEKTGRKHIVSTAIEHKAVLEPLAQMAKLGFEVELAPVTRGGYVEPEIIKQLLRPDTLLVSVMHANNETGVLQPVHDIADIVAALPMQSSTTVQRAVLFHTDAAQTFGKEVDALKTLRCDLLSISAHKIFGPQGVGALFVRRDGANHRAVQPLMTGGSQERGLRPGTVPVALAVGFGEAARLASLEWRQRRVAAETARTLILGTLKDIEHTINGDTRRSMPHVLNVRVHGAESEALMMAASSEFAISNGSACTANSYTPSHVLSAMGLTDDEIEESVRISWGHHGANRLPPDLPMFAKHLQLK